MPPMSPTALFWILVSLVSVVGVIAAVVIRRKRKATPTGWFVTSERLALLLDVESRLEDWRHFKDLPAHDPRFSWGRRVHDMVEGYKTDVRLANGLADARQDELLNVLGKLGKRNRELVIQSQRCDELLETIDDLERDSRMFAADQIVIGDSGWFVKDYPNV